MSVKKPVHTSVSLNIRLNGRTNTPEAACGLTLSGHTDIRVILTIRRVVTNVHKQQLIMWIIKKKLSCLSSARLYQQHGLREGHVGWSVDWWAATTRRWWHDAQWLETHPQDFRLNSNSRFGTRGQSLFYIFGALTLRKCLMRWMLLPIGIMHTQPQLNQQHDGEHSCSWCAFCHNLWI